LAIHQPHFDAMGMLRRFREQLFHNTASQLTCPLMLLQYNVNLKSGPNIRSQLSIHVRSTSLSVYIQLQQSSLLFLPRTTKAAGKSSDSLNPITVCIVLSVNQQISITTSLILSL